MSYIVFALKWRPKNFDEVIGQEHTIATLKSSIEHQRLSHAYLFAGPRGTGKTSTARIFAKALNCVQGPTVNPCGACSSCLGIAKGNSLDVLEIDGASNRGIDEIRALRENVKFAPVQGKFKIYIIDEVHQITSDGFNALLKTLEEPPPFVKFIFATTHPHKVLPTILSRCQRFDFKRISARQTVAQLEHIITQEGMQVDKNVLFAIARASDGSLRDAESILDQLASFSLEKITLDDVVSMLGLVEQEALLEITDRIIKKDSLTVLTLFHTILDRGKDAGIFLTNLIEHFRNLMVAKIASTDTQLIDLPNETCEKILEQAQAFTLEELFVAFNILVNTQEMAKRMESVLIPLEISLVKLSHDKRMVGGPAVTVNTRPVPAKPAMAQPKDARQPEAPGSAHTLYAAPSAALSTQGMHTTGAAQYHPPQDVSLSQVQGAWDTIIDAVSKQKISIGSYLSEGTPTKVMASVVTIAFPKNYSLHKESLERRDNRELIEKIISETCHVPLRTHLVLTDTHKKNSSFDDEVVKSALQAFDGRVIKEE